MKSFPMILVREFDGRETSYRVAARRARNYWELIANVHNIFAKSWEHYNAHLHFDGYACNDRMSPSEWDAGGYFDPEFVVDGRLVLYAHFEQVNPLSESNMDESGRFETRQEDRLRYWGTYGDEGIRTKRKFTEDIDDSFEERDLDPYPSFPGNFPRKPLILDPVVKQNYTFKSALTLPVAIHEVITIDESSSRRLLDTGVVIGRALPKCCLDPNVRPVARAMISKVGALIAYIPRKYSKRNLTKGDAQIAMADVEYTSELERYASGENRSQAIKAMIEGRNAPDMKNTAPGSHLFISPPLSTTCEPLAPELPIISVDDSQHQRLCNEGIIISRAKGHCCRIPHMRPVVRAMLSTKNAIIAYVPAQHVKHASTYGEVQISLKDVDFSKELAGLPPLKTTEAIRAKIDMKRKVGRDHAMYEPGVDMEGEMEKEEEQLMEAHQTIEGEEKAGFFSDTTDVPEGGALH